MYVHRDVIFIKDNDYVIKMIFFQIQFVYKLYRNFKQFIKSFLLTHSLTIQRVR